MSDFRAISGVSLTLHALLRDRMELPTGVTLADLRVTMATPLGSAQSTPPTPEEPRVNLFLYQVSENASLKNLDRRASPGSYGHPPLSLNLHYLMTGYGAKLETDTNYLNESLAQLMLGSAMRVLHDLPVITSSLQTVRAPVGQTILHASLRGEYEKLKICLDPVSLEDLTKLWTSLTIPYRLSAAYSVSVVQIESRRMRRFPQLVGEPPAAGPRIRVIPLQTPFVSSLAVQRQDEAAGTERSAPIARVGDTLILKGESFIGESVLVSFNGFEIPVDPITSQRIEVVVPDEDFSYRGATVSIPEETRLQPGPIDVQVKSVAPGTPHASFLSNRTTMMLVPHIQVINPTAPRTIAISGTRLFADDLDGETLVGRVLFPADAYDLASHTEIRVTLPDSLPFRSVVAYVTPPLGAFPSLSSAPQIDVTIGTNGPHTVLFPSRPTNMEEAAVGLQQAIRSATVTPVSQAPLFENARAATIENRFVILPGGLQAAVSIASTPDATQLNLDSGVSRTSYLSGQLEPFQPLSTPPGRLRVRIGATTATAELASAPTSVGEAATLLGAAIRAASGGAAFTNALVVALGEQLLIIPGTNAAVSFAPVPGVDDTTVSELGLSGSHRVRVRVNGAESLGPVDRVELPL